MKCKKL